MKRWNFSLTLVGLATGLLLSTSAIPQVHADDQHERDPMETTEPEAPARAH
jgi:hypothetical protein